MQPLGTSDSTLQKLPGPLLSLISIIGDCTAIAEYLFLSLKVVLTGFRSDLIL